jgi:hypothetical protein
MAIPLENRIILLAGSEGGLDRFMGCYAKYGTSMMNSSTAFEKTIQEMSNNICFDKTSLHIDPRNKWTVCDWVCAGFCHLDDRILNPNAGVYNRNGSLSFLTTLESMALLDIHGHLIDTCKFSDIGLSGRVVGFGERILDVITDMLNPDCPTDIEDMVF